MLQKKRCAAQFSFFCMFETSILAKNRYNERSSCVCGTSKQHVSLGIHDAALLTAPLLQEVDWSINWFMLSKNAQVLMGEGLGTSSKMLTVA